MPARSSLGTRAIFPLLYLIVSRETPGHIPEIPRQVHVKTASGGDDTGWGGTFNNNWMKGLGVNDDVDSREDYQ